MIQRPRSLDRLPRRGFLQLSGIGLLGLAAPQVGLSHPRAEDRGQLGRVLEATVDIHREPSFDSDKVRTFWRDHILDLAGAVVGAEEPAHNRVWYQVPDMGFVHSSAVQPVRDEPNDPLWVVPYRGVLMEVTVPFADAYWKPSVDSDKVYRMYYQTTHWINGVVRDSKLHRWYRILDDKFEYEYFARGEAFRPIPVAELTPISPEIPLEDKHIEVSLNQQWIQCYEGSQLVFTAKVSTGKRFSDGSYLTPEGEFATFRKRGSRHMTAGNLATGYDLPGVPWVSYITEDGVSFHGTYWHNDFGAPRSHGCINMTPHDAKWLFRWTQPVVPLEDPEVYVNFGTRAVVRA